MQISQKLPVKNFSVFFNFTKAIRTTVLFLIFFSDEMSKTT